METILDFAWDAIGPHVGTLALIGVGIGLVVGLTRKLIDKVGNTYVLIGVGLIVVVVWGVKYLQAPKVEYVDREVEKVVERKVTVPEYITVEKVVKDTSESNALRDQLQAKEQENKGLLERIFGYEKKENSARQIEIAKELAANSIEERRKELIERARKVPYFEVELKDEHTIIINRYSTNHHSYEKDNLSFPSGTVLVRAEYVGKIEVSREGITYGVFNSCVLNGENADGGRFGKPKRLSGDVYRYKMIPLPMKDDRIDIELLVADLNEGEIEFDLGADLHCKMFIDDTIEKLERR